jgi:Carboxylesterase family
MRRKVGKLKVYLSLFKHFFLLSSEESGGEKKPDPEKTKFNPLASIRFPNISVVFNKFRKSPRNEDIELGSGPRAGLASMETLDDSTKDPWNPENSPDVVDAEKDGKSGAVEKELCEQDGKEKKLPFLAGIRNYNCSIGEVTSIIINRISLLIPFISFPLLSDDFALIAGIILFLILVALILAFTFLGTTKQTRVAPIRDGRVLAITSCGEVEGLVEDSAVAFRGIPYAKPPINNLRFEPAQVIDDIKYCWNGTFQAHNSSTECLQVFNGVVQGDENCLTLDVITPEVRYINLLPVVVMIGANDYFGGSPGLKRKFQAFSSI